MYPEILWSLKAPQNLIWVIETGCTHVKTIGTGIEKYRSLLKVWLSQHAQTDALISHLVDKIQSSLLRCWKFVTSWCTRQPARQTHFSQMCVLFFSNSSHFFSHLGFKSCCKSYPKCLPLLPSPCRNSFCSWRMGTNPWGLCQQPHQSHQPPVSESLTLVWFIHWTNLFWRW